MSTLTATAEQVEIPGRFNGPPASANGGYVSGLVAEPLEHSAAVRLTMPPPLDVPLVRQREHDGTVVLLDGDAVVAHARPARAELHVPPPPTLAAAVDAAERYAGRRPEDHVFPTCFVCGPHRHADGMRIYPGRTGDGDQLATPWVPGEDLASGGVVDPKFVWAALDCPSGFACMPPGRQSVLASMTATIEAPVLAGRPYIVTAWPIASEGRKHRAGSAVHDADGRLVALAEALWITLREQA